MCFITFGIAYIWVLPYMQATYANAYHSLKPVSIKIVDTSSVIETESIESASEENAEE